MLFRAKLVSLFKRIAFVLLISFISITSVQVTQTIAAGTVSTCDEASLNTALTGGGTVTFSCSGTITLTVSITIASNTTLDGAGQSVTISGNGERRVFYVPSGVTFNLKNITVANGYNESGDGSGIFNDGTLTVTNCTFSGNSADEYGGGIANAGTLTVTNSTFSGNSAGEAGGGIDNEGTLTVTNSTFSGNSSDGNGGGICSGDTLTVVTNSTFSGNSAGEAGGGIASFSGTLTLNNSTFSGNSAGEAGGGIAIDYAGTLNFTNTIIANSTSGYDCAMRDSTVGTNVNNLVRTNYPGFSCGSTYLTSNPNLGALSSNGGNTQTFALLAGSPAIDVGDAAACAAAPVNNLDQRGLSRTQGTGCDIGAYEYRSCANANNPALIDGTSNYYKTIASAYTVASTGRTIKLQSKEFSEILNLNLANIIKLQGGYDCDYVTNVGTYSTISGSLTISGSSGTVTVENIKIK